MKEIFSKLSTLKVGQYFRAWLRLIEPREMRKLMRHSKTFFATQKKKIILDKSPFLPPQKTSNFILGNVWLNRKLFVYFFKNGGIVKTVDRLDIDVDYRDSNNF